MRGKPNVLIRVGEELGITPACAGKTCCNRSALSGEGDHPRVCGENRQRHRRACRGAGSPPRVRGKPVAGSDIDKNEGITPACAGKTSGKRMWKSGLRDHPRVCGENSCSLRPNSFFSGSPPRVRGKQAKGRLQELRRGITPACAGKTLR